MTTIETSRPPRYPLAALAAAGATVALVACGSDGPRWAKGFDQIDVASWVALCGDKRGTSEVTDGERRYHEETFEQPEDRAYPGSPSVDCSVGRDLKSQRLVFASIRVGGKASAVSPELLQKLAALLEDLVPPSTRDALRAVATSPERTKRTAGGLRFEGGLDRRPQIDSTYWNLRVDSRTP